MFKFNFKWKIGGKKFYKSFTTTSTKTFVTLRGFWLLSGWGSLGESIKKKMYDKNIFLRKC